MAVSPTMAAFWAVAPVFWYTFTKVSEILVVSIIRTMNDRLGLPSVRMTH